MDRSQVNLWSWFLLANRFMANKKHVEVLRSGRSALENFRHENPDERLDLEDANLDGCDLSRHSTIGKLPCWTGLSDANLRNASLAEANLSGLNLERADLGKARLPRAMLEGANIFGANLVGSDLGGANLDSVSFLCADLTDAQLTQASLKNADLRCKSLRNARLTGTDLSRGRLSGVDCQGAVFDECNLSHAHLDYADLRHASVRSVKWKGVNANAARLDCLDFKRADLSDADMRYATLTDACLDRADLEGTDLSWASCEGASIRKSNLVRTKLDCASFDFADLTGSDFELASAEETSFDSALMVECNLRDTNLFASHLDRVRMASIRAVGTRMTGCSLVLADMKDSLFFNVNLKNGDLSFADLRGAIFTKCYMSGSNVKGAKFGESVFAATDISACEGLTEVEHRLPSSISVDILCETSKQIPEGFLSNCQVPPAMMSYLPSLENANPIQFYSCFLAYSQKDEEFCKRLVSALQLHGLSTWFAAEDLKAGHKVLDQIDQAIRRYDKMLIILSAHSIESNWVLTEVRRAKKLEVTEQRRVLFPIRVTSYDSLLSWNCIDPETGLDIAADIREYYIPDFSNWQDHDCFEKTYYRLLDDLRQGGNERFETPEK